MHKKSNSLNDQDTMDIVNKKKVRGIGYVLIISVATFIFGMEACTWDTIGDVTPEHVSFTSDIIPFFEASCAITGCHVAAGIKPNLSAVTAYSTLTSGDYISSPATAEQSKIYEKISTGSMAKYATSQERALVLKWIQQGANNN
jgi:hypothetical protein